MKESVIARRRMLKTLSGIGFAGLCVSEAGALEQDIQDFTPLGENDKVKVVGDIEVVLKKTYDAGCECTRKYGSCSRASVAALQEALPFVPEDPVLVRAASCVDGGATTTRMASCGAFTGCGMVIGYVCGKGEPGDTALSHTLMKELHKKFYDEYGSVICHGVRGAVDGQCAGVVGNASRWTAEILLKQFA